MRVLESVHRLAAPAVGLIGAAAVCIACTSSTSGSPASTPAASAPPGTPTISIPSITGIPSLTGIPSISGIPSIGGDQANSAFCKDLNGQNLSDLGSTSDLGKAATLFDKLSADAPAQIKPDVDKVRDFVHGLMSGKMNPSDAQNISQAAVNIGQYAAAHCAG